MSITGPRPVVRPNDFAWWIPLGRSQLRQMVDIVSVEKSGQIYVIRERGRVFRGVRRVPHYEVHLIEKPIGG